MTDSIVIMLAGSIRPSPLRRALDEPPLCLPIVHGVRLLDAWLEVIAGEMPRTRVRIVVTDDADCALISAAFDEAKAPLRIEIVKDSASWRGSGGVLRDVTDDCADSCRVLVVEAATLPPATIHPIGAALDDEVSAVIGAGVERDPAGVYLFRRAAVAAVGQIGYHDLKEQVIPDLAKAGHRIALAETGSEVIRLRDRASYLAAVRATAAGRFQRRDTCVFSVDAISNGVDRAARVAGGSIIETGAVVDPTAVVHDSVILRGARVGEKAIVARSIVGRGCTIAPRARIVDHVLNHADEKAHRLTEPAVARGAARDSGKETRGSESRGATRIEATS